jgi:hypothetical protein
MTEWLINRPQQNPRATVLLAHGAGAAMDSEFMTLMAELLCQGGCEVIRFEFPYMSQRRRGGSKRPPERAPVLMQCWCEQVARVRADLPSGRRLIIAGKSLGGRMASMVADALGADGLVCLGYPFHPTGKPERLRVDHLQNLQTPALIVQGTRDPLGSFDEVQAYALAPSIKLHWLPDGDHDFKPRVKSGYSWQQHLQSAAASVYTFIDSLTANQL